MTLFNAIRAMRGDDLRPKRRTKEAQVRQGGNVVLATKDYHL